MKTIGSVECLWRYPVKSLRAQALREVNVGHDGLEGDRCSALFVTSPEHARVGKTYRGKEHNRLHLISDASDAEVLARERGVAIRESGGDFLFDAAPVSIILDSWIRELEGLLGHAIDAQRFRPNIVVHTANSERRRERDFVGKRLTIGTCVLEVTDPIDRCVTVTYDPRTGEPNPAVLRTIANERGNVMGIYCTVVTPGVMRIGDVIEG